MGRRPAPAPRRPAPTTRQASTRAAAPAPSAVPAPMQPQRSGGGMLSGIGSTIAQGMAFGTGSAIAHQAVGAAVGSMSGGSSAPAEAPAQAGYEYQAAGAPQQGYQAQGACGDDKQMFFECLKVNSGDQQACSFLYEQLQMCQRTQNQVQFS